jgi:tetratricopeptide (TPR) repeat protein
MQTSYLFISSSKSSIAKLDKEVLGNARQQQQQQQQGQQRQRHADEQQPQLHDYTQAQAQALQHTNPHGVVEYRKRISRFRQFLAEEEKFWTLLIQRMYRTFGLTEALPALVELGLCSESQDGAAATSHPNSETGDSTHLNRGRFPNGRNHYQFPPENPDSNAFIPRPEDRGGRLTIFSKALVCLGDIARYRELYNDSNGRPRAGHESMASSRKKNRRGQEIAPRARNYDKAQRCYEQARALVPNEGNPWHQLAILSSYRKDTFSSVVKHYRALCVQLPYDTAMDNLNLLATRTLDTWKRRSRQEREKPLENGTPPHVVFETFKERIIALHALWRIGAEKGIERYPYAPT